MRLESSVNLFQHELKQRLFIRQAATTGIPGMISHSPSNFVASLFIVIVIISYSPSLPNVEHTFCLDYYCVMDTVSYDTVVEIWVDTAILGHTWTSW